MPRKSKPEILGEDGKTNLLKDIFNNAFVVKNQSKFLTNYVSSKQWQVFKELN